MFVKLLFCVLIQLVILLHQSFLRPNEGGGLLVYHRSPVASIIWRDHLARVVVSPRIRVGRHPGCLTLEASLVYWGESFDLFLKDIPWVYLVNDGEKAS